MQSTETHPPAKISSVWSSAIKRRHSGELQKLAKKVSNLCKNPMVIWQELVHQDVITQDFVDNMDQIGTWLEMADCWIDVEKVPSSLKKDEKKALLAKVFLPFTDKEITPVWIEEIVEGRFDMDEKFSNQVLEMFTELTVPPEVGPPWLPAKKLSLRQKTARAVAIAAISAIMTASNVLPVVPPSLPAQYAYEQHRYEEWHEGDTSSVSSQEERQTEDQKSGSESFDPVENSPPNESPGGSSDIWYVGGSERKGNYRTATSSEFIHHDGKFGWLVIPSVAMQNPTVADSTIQKEEGILTTLPHSFSLPRKDDHFVKPSSVKIFVNGEPVSPDQYILTFTKDRNYVVTFKGYDPPNEGRFRVDFDTAVGHESVIDLSDPNLTANFVDFHQMPLPILSAFYQIRDSDMDSYEKAKALEALVHDSLIYSLDASYSNYYQKASTKSEFIRRIFEGQHVDCDGAATALVGLLRNLGLKARLVFGYTNGSPLDADDKTLTAGLENHAWVEVYIEGMGWVELDATPTRIDPSGQDAIQKQKKENVEQGKGDATKEQGIPQQQSPDRQREQPNGNKEGGTDTTKEDGQSGNAPSQQEQQDVQGQDHGNGQTPDQEQTGGGVSGENNGDTQSEQSPQKDLSETAQEMLSTLQSIGDFAQSHPAEGAASGAGLSELVNVLAYTILKRVKKKTQIAKSSAHEIARKMMGETMYTPTIQTEIDTVLEDVSDKELGLEHLKGHGKLVKAVLIALTNFPLKKSFWESYGVKKRTEEAMRKMDALVPSQNGNTVEPLPTVVELLGVPQEKVESIVVGNNTATLIQEIKKDAPVAMRTVCINQSGKYDWQVEKVLKPIIDPTTVIAKLRVEPVEKVCNDVVELTWERYKKEQERRLQKQKEPSFLQKKLKRPIESPLPPLPLQEAEFKRIMREEALQPMLMIHQLWLDEEKRKNEEKKKQVNPLKRLFQFIRH